MRKIQNFKEFRSIAEAENKFIDKETFYCPTIYSVIVNLKVFFN